jgi:hypothetical protein
MLEIENPGISIPTSMDEIENPKHEIETSILSLLIAGLSPLISESP